ncbi:MAG: hypothetical protein JXQ29_10345 [Planctomycetes bacterium]|nr:hypothetical protein [Planctomycetota bacterium]
MRRRRFLRILLGGAAALAAPLGWLAARVRPADRRTEAHRSAQYPGPVRALDPAAVGRPGPWAG